MTATSTEARPTVADPGGRVRDADPERRVARDLRTVGVVAPVGIVALQLLPAVGPLCPLRRTTGVPCPLCGLTTGLNALGRGDVGQALAANPLAPALVAMVAVAWVVALMGRPGLPVRTATLRRTLTVALPGLWLFQLHRYDLI